ncbi:LOW QUALITY PROTEIN: uncharacterized protein LOC103524309 [Diaphorina citri]|uniref:LOW QUALITY PROTEIN: uncharacterized protein LOC103524309 n=1 Tax=Diaphorina citri TaxID=121845 RepID=A0A1S3DTA0_DIACI|nr:LOW QUALITY PROTEIN: uncharacterized protein LOC103524309 [Diaphorina citri]
MPLHKVSVSPMEIITAASAPYQHPQSPIKVNLNRSSPDRCSSQTSSLSSNGFDICRICHCEVTPEASPDVSPAYCFWFSPLVHQACLQQWIKSSNIRCCELCKFQFIMQTKTKPFSEWEHLEMTGMERRKLLCAVLFHAVALTCVIWSLYVLIERTVDEIYTGILEWPFWIKLIVVVIGFTGGVVFMYIQCKAYLHICQRWKAYNRVIYVQNAPEKPSLPSPQLAMKSPGCPESHVVHMEHPPHLCAAPAPSYVDPSWDEDMMSNTKSIDLKGVRNLHIFFNEENRICVQKDEKQSRLVDYLETGEPSNPETTTSNVISRPEHDNINGGGTTWHIQIEKTSAGPDITKAIDNRTFEEVTQAELDARPYRNTNEDYKVTCNNDDSESPVLNLQIKKAEIVIKFGGSPNENVANNTNDTAAVENDRGDNAVNININPEEAKAGSSKLTELPNPDLKKKTNESQADDEGSEDSLSGCGSPTCRLLPEPTEYNAATTSVRPKSYPFDKRQSRNSGTWTPNVEKENPTGSDQDMGSQSPLLAQTNNSETNKTN